LIEELTNEHEPQIWYFENPQGISGFPYGCTMPPVSDPENWNWTTWSLAGSMIGFAMHNSPYRITVQWRYGVYMKGPRGPFQTYIEVNVENLVIERATFGQIAAFDSEGESKVKSSSLPDYFIWDGKQAIPPINFWLRCASKGKGAQVTFYIFRSDQSGPIRTVTMTNLEFGPSPPSKPYTFVWDGKNDAKKDQPPGIYLYDVVLDAPWKPMEDFLRSSELDIAFARSGEVRPGDGEATLRVEYLLLTKYGASKAWLEVFDPDLRRIAGPAQGTLLSYPDWGHAYIQLGRTERKGKYLFLVSAIDNVTSYKDHLRRPALQNSLTGKSCWVWIDPGHGHNRGASCTQHRPPHREENLVLQLAQELQNWFNSNPWTNSRGFIGYNWQISRPPNTDYSNRANRAFLWGYEKRLHNRPERWSADLIVCLHLNSSPNLSANGTYTFYDRDVPLSFDFATAINNRLRTLQGIVNHGVYDQYSRPAGWPDRPGVANILGAYRSMWLRPGPPYKSKRPAPSTLIECIFLSNHNDENWMFTGQRSNVNRDNFVQQLFLGIDDYAHGH